MEQKKANKSFVKIFIISALLAFGLTFVWFTFFRNSDLIELKNTQSILIEDVEDPSFDLMTPANSSSGFEAWNSAVQKFSKKEYSGTLGALNPLLQNIDFKMKHSAKYRLLKGVCLLKTGKADVAIKQLSSVNTASENYEQIRWFLALAYYYSGNYNEALAVFLEVEGLPNHFNGDQARKYIDSIKSM